MRRSLTLALVSVLPSFLLAAAPVSAQSNSNCAPDNAGLKLPAGFCATIFADSIPSARHIAVAPNGDVFVSATGRAGGIVALRDPGHTGHATVRQQFASGFASSEVALFDGHLYTEAPIRKQGSPPTTSILRYPLKAGELVPSGPPDTVVQNLPSGGDHTTRNFVITRDGTMYVNVGTATNSCQSQNRKKDVMGVDPCVELETRGGLWRFDARKQHQTPSASNHYARGIRNEVGMAINPADGKLYTTQHGRDQLSDFADKLGLDSAAAVHYSAENPAEELVQPNQGEDFGWPYCYYSVDEHHLVLAPEYGGDGKKTAQCAQKKEPVAVFPGHWAPNGLMFYTGSNFPARYKNGAFIAFHGSWNRSPEPQAGFNVVFQPLSKGKAAGAYEVFADNFRTGPRTGIHRPTGLAQMTDGSLLVADDAGGRVYKITYVGK